MDINDLRSIFTVLAFVAFIAIVVWAWSGKRHQEFDAAARMALDDEPAAGCQVDGRPN
jgi:cytochrome c oxidase cbb3-type subunit 4